MTPPADAAEVLREFRERFAGALADGTLVRLTLTSATPAAAPEVRLLARLVEVRGGTVLSITHREARRDRVENFPVDRAAGWLEEQLPARFTAAFLATTRRDWQLTLTGGVPRLVGHTPRRATPPDRRHDRAKATTTADPAARDWLAALGFLGSAGEVLPRAQDKYRQLQRYAEILGHLVRDLGWQPGREVRVADMGCGRGALTFAAWQLLRRDLGLNAGVTGIEAETSLAADAEATARRLHLDGLRFVAADIRHATLDRLDALLALHACDTATDAALLRGIRAGAELLVVAPCCQKELRPQLGRPEPLAPVLEHGLFAGRLADWLTDGLRALYLEWAGYRVKAIEFVDAEHTPKNLLLTAVRAHAPRDPARRRRVVELKAFFGIRHHALDPLLEEAAHG